MTFDLHDDEVAGVSVAQGLDEVFDLGDSSGVDGVNHVSGLEI